VAHRDLVGTDDVALLAVDVVQQGDAGAPVGVVLDVGHLRGDGVLVPAEVDEPVLLLVAPALVARRDPAVDVATRLLRLGDDERALGGVPGDLGEVGEGHPAPSGGGGLGLANGHGVPYRVSNNSILSPSASLTI